MVVFTISSVNSGFIRYCSLNGGSGVMAAWKSVEARFVCVSRDIATVNFWREFDSRLPPFSSEKNIGNRMNGGSMMASAERDGCIHSCSA